jgi:hypothetical protein
MIFHDAETPLRSSIHFSDAETPMCSTVYFSDAETTLCSTVHFSDAETPLKNTGDHFPDAETSLIGTFISSQSQKHPIPPSFSLPKQLRPALVSLFPSSAATPFATTFPVAETPIVSNFPSVSPMLKHHCSAFFIPFHHLFHPPSSTKQFRPAIVSPLFCAETPLFSISHPFPIIFFTPLIDETIPSSNCFASLLKHHHSAPHSSMLLKHHFPATFRHSSIMLKHPPSAPSDSFPILKHQFSAVLHRNFSIFLCYCNTRSPPTANSRL